MILTRSALVMKRIFLSCMGCIATQMEGASKGVMGEAGAGGGDIEEAGAASCDWGTPAEGCSEV